MRGVPSAIAAVLIVGASLGLDGCDPLDTGPTTIGVDSAIGSAIAAPMPITAFAFTGFGAQPVTWSGDGSKLLMVAFVRVGSGIGNAVYSVAVASGAVTVRFQDTTFMTSIACFETRDDCHIGVLSGATMRILRLGPLGDTSTIIPAVGFDIVSTPDGKFVMYANGSSVFRLDQTTGTSSRIADLSSVLAAISPDGGELDGVTPGGQRPTSVVRTDVASGSRRVWTPPTRSGWALWQIDGVQWVGRSLNVLVQWDSGGAKTRYYEYDVDAGTETFLGETKPTMVRQPAWSAARHRAVTSTQSECFASTTSCELGQFEIIMLDHGITTRIARVVAGSLWHTTLSRDGKTVAYGVSTRSGSWMYLKPLPP